MLKREKGAVMPIVYELPADIDQVHQCCTVSTTQLLPAESL